MCVEVIILFNSPEIKVRGWHNGIEWCHKEDMALKSSEMLAKRGKQRKITFFWKTF